MQCLQPLHIGPGARRRLQRVPHTLPLQPDHHRAHAFAPEAATLPCQASRRHNRTETPPRSVNGFAMDQGPRLDLQHVCAFGQTRVHWRGHDKLLGASRAQIAGYVVLAEAHGQKRQDVGLRMGQPGIAVALVRKGIARFRARQLTCPALIACLGVARLFSFTLLALQSFASIRTLASRFGRTTVLLCCFSYAPVLGTRGVSISGITHALRINRLVNLYRTGSWSCPHCFTGGHSRRL
mmetsp:Transcript_15099/g.47161  ORF Transcript_15099/g.47161 Transcript_15099/m.47161 type:complete len:238 (+) Transcript_15099:128-841(+)